jgi:hypothetical protein
LQDSEADALAELTEGAVGADRTIVQYSFRRPDSGQFFENISNCEAGPVAACPLTAALVNALTPINASQRHIR